MIETICDVSQAVLVTGAAILAGTALVKDVLEEVREIIALHRERIQR